MLFLAVFFLEFILLFFLSRKLTRWLSGLLLRLTRSQVVTIQILSFLFLPGIIIHELSHLLTAAILLVPVGEIEFLPKVTEGRVQLGSVAIGKTDPFRRAFIGLAPILVGLFFLYAAFAFYSQSSYQFFSVETLILLYVVFEIGNTMFSSTKDLEGLIEVLLTGIFLFIVFYIFAILVNLNVPTISFSFDKIEGFISPLVTTLTLTVLLNGIFLIILRIFRG